MRSHEEQLPRVEITNFYNGGSVCKPVGSGWSSKLECSEQPWRRWGGGTVTGLGFLSHHTYILLSSARESIDQFIPFVHFTHPTYHSAQYGLLLLVFLLALGSRARVA